LPSAFCVVVLCHALVALRDLPSFPTRRSSDLNQRFFTYNDLESVQQAVAEVGDDLAAIIVTPFRHDAWFDQEEVDPAFAHGLRADRKSTRLNSSHVKISYAVFCLKKKKHNVCC